MTPRQLWNAIGAVIAEEAGCTVCWEYQDGTRLDVGKLSPEVMAAIALRVNATMLAPYLEAVQS